MKRRAAAAAAVLLLAITPVLSTPAGAAPAAFAVTDASLRWGVNDETNNAAFAPGTWNLLSAGTIGNPGAGGQTLRTANSGATWSNGAKAGWSNHVGAVSVEDLGSNGSYAATTFDGTRRDSAGTSTSPPGSAIVAETQIVLRGGTGTVDPVAGTATLAWKGSFSVLYYSGMTFFGVSDPSLQVAPGSAKLTATVSGYATSMDDQSKWQRLAPERVILADFGAIDLAGAKGFSANPRYLGVRYDAPAGGTSQVRSGARWGSFPTSLVTFLNKVGMAAYWYSSGGATDAKKVAAPVTVSWDGTSPIAAPTRTPAPSQVAQPSVSLAPEAPASSTPSTPPTTRPRSRMVPQAVAALAPPTARTLAPSTITPSPIADVAADHAPAETVYAAREVPLTPASSTSATWQWVLGGVFVLVAVLLGGYAYRPRGTGGRARP